MSAGVRARIVVRGRVQGVFYRGSMREQARRLGIRGWVQNRPDGVVEAEAQGERGALDALIAWCRQGPPGARVDDVAVEWIAPAPDDEHGFVVRR